MAIQVSSWSLMEGKPIPKKHTGEGEDVRRPWPGRRFRRRPRNSRSICDDLGAPRLQSGSTG